MCLLPLAMILSPIYPNCWLDSALLLFFWWCALSCIEATKNEYGWTIMYGSWISIVSERVVVYCVHLGQKHERLSYKSLPAIGSETVVVLNWLANGIYQLFPVSDVQWYQYAGTNQKIFMDVCNLFIFPLSSRTIIITVTALKTSRYIMDLKIYLI